MTSRRWISCVLLGLLLPLLAQADTESHRRAVEKLFVLTHMEQKVNEGVETTLQLQLRQSPQLAPYREVLRAFLVKHIGWESMKEELTQTYLWEFTEQELKEMNAFYASPTGRKVIERVPVLVQQRNRMAMQRIQDNVGELQQEIAKAAEQAKTNTPAD